MLYTAKEKALLKGSPFLDDLEIEMEVAKHDYDKMKEYSKKFQRSFSLK